MLKPKASWKGLDRSFCCPVICTKFTTFSFDLTCNHLNFSKKSYLFRYIRHCRRIDPYLKFYKQQIDYYNRTIYNMLENEIGLILLSFNNNNRKKMFLTTILRTIASKVIGLGFEVFYIIKDTKPYKKQ